MAQVTLTINGKNYGIACDEGQEQRVVDLAHYVDSKVKEMYQAGAATNETHALVLAALVIADESFDLMENATSGNNGASDTEGEQQQQAQATNNNLAEHEAELASAIEQLADRIDAVADRMKAA